MFHLLTPLTRVCIGTGTVKPDAVSVTNLLTYTSIETRIGAAASVDAMMLLWCVFVSTLQQHSKEFLAYHAHRIGLARALWQPSTNLTGNGSNR